MKHVTNFSMNIFIFSCIIAMFISCSEDTPYVEEPTPPVEEPVKQIEYYVKYESHIFIPSSRQQPIYITVQTEKGKQLIEEAPNNWEGIFGPFKELTTLSISGSSVASYNPNKTSSSGRISICRGNQPFILKAEKKAKGTSFSVEYVVTKEDLE